MAGNLWGADVAQLRQLAQQFGGASSLVARGFATVEAGGELSVSGPVAAVTAALTSATRRMEIALLAPDSADSVLSIESDDYKILLQPRAYQSWFAMAQNPAVSPAEGNFHVIRRHLEDNPAGGATIRRREVPAGRMLLLKRQRFLDRGRQRSRKRLHRRDSWAKRRRCPGTDQGHQAGLTSGF